MVCMNIEIHVKYYAVLWTKSIEPALVEIPPSPGHTIVLKEYVSDIRNLTALIFQICVRT